MYKRITAIATAAMVLLPVVLLLGAACSTSAAPISHIDVAFDVSGSAMKKNVVEVSSARDKRNLLNRRGKSEATFMEYV